MCADVSCDIHMGVLWENSEQSSQTSTSVLSNLTGGPYERNGLLYGDFEPLLEEIEDFSFKLKRIYEEFSGGLSAEGVERIARHFATRPDVGARGTYVGRREREIKMLQYIGKEYSIDVSVFESFLEQMGRPVWKDTKTGDGVAEQDGLAEQDGVVSQKDDLAEEQGKVN